MARAHRDHAGLIDELIGQLRGDLEIGQAAAHEALGRGDRVDRVLGLMGRRVEADLATLAVQIAHHRRQQHAALRVGQAFGHAMAHRRHQGMGGAQVDAHRDATLVRVGRLAGFGDLQQRHVSG